MRAWGVALSVLALFAACHSYRPEAKRPPETPPPAAPAPLAPAAPEFVPSEELLRQNVHLAPSAKNGDGGTIIEGLRIDGRGQVAADVANPALIGGARVPEFQGGGFLFWSVRALYLAKSFLAPLEPVASLPSTASRASFGKDVALLHFSDGGRYAFNLATRRRIAMPVPGLIDTAALGDGRAVRLTDPNRVWILAAGGQNWSDQTQRAGAVSDLFTAEDSLWLRRDAGQLWRVERDGALVELSAVPQNVQKHDQLPQLDPRWPANAKESPMKRAVRRGIPIDTQTVLVEVDGHFARIDAKTGALSQIGPGILTPGSDCELVPISGDVLAACRSSNGTSVVVSGAAGPQPEIEKVFASHGVFYAGADGTLAFGGACRQQPKPPRWAICVRQGPGLWRELEEQPHPDSTDPWSGDGGLDAGSWRSVVAVSRWVPTHEGGALGLVGGDHGGILDAARGTFTPFSSDAYKSASELFANSSGVFVDGLTVDGDGSITGYGTRETLRLGRDGTLTRSPLAFQRIQSAGANALASDSTGRLWQSTDFGKNWTEVARPPGALPNTHFNITACSRAGCDLGRWYRLGFRPTPPSLERRPEAPPTQMAAAPATARLVCEKTGPPEMRFATRALDANGGLIEEFDLGARKFPAKNPGESGLLSFNYGSNADGLLRAATVVDRNLIDQADPGFGRALSQTRTLRMLEPLGDSPPSGITKRVKIAESKFNWLDIFRAAVRMGADTTPPSVDARPALPVLGSKPGTSEGLLLVDPSGVFSWARSGQPARVFAFGPEHSGFMPIAALTRAKDELVVLGEDERCSARLFAFSAGRGARTLLELPPRAGQPACPRNSDTLAELADGTIAILRMLSLEAPSADDPALVVRPNQNPTALAPWSTLSPAEACNNDSNALRALIQVNERWLGLEIPGVGAGEEAFMLALVRWSPARVCVEAVELAAGTIGIGEQSLPTSVLARFTPTASATRRGVAPGGELAEPLSCKLVP